MTRDRKPPAPRASSLVDAAGRELDPEPGAHGDDGGESSTAANAPRAAAARPKRVSRHVQPLGPRVLVRLLGPPAQLASGLFIPDTARDKDDAAVFGEVIEVARTPARGRLDLDTDGEDDRDAPDLGENVSGVPVGAKVLVPRERTIKVPWDDTLRLVEVRHVLAIVDEIDEDELQ